ncbi:ComE operon protein 2 [Oceanobacillus jeddahense]|uniref:ComE operon protein 2 n=1 Tax=Oceanobacillus jeddahense TaxID=1462527 RepID=UPI000595DB70|nr:ComE operon protein 2 [Oceanobacillus jeddahense]
MERIAWDQYFMAQSHLLALRSTCTRLMVGATIVRDKRIIAGGYNGSVSGDVHCIDEGCYVIDGHCVRTVHAEANALLQCAKFGVPTDGADVYVTHFPCLQCTKQLIQSGIKNLFYAEDYKNHPYAVQLFEEAGVKTQKVPLVDAVVDTKFAEKNAFVHELMEKLDALNVTSGEKETMKAEADRLFFNEEKKN